MKMNDGGVADIIESDSYCAVFFSSSQVGWLQLHNVRSSVARIDAFECLHFCQPYRANPRFVNRHSGTCPSVVMRFAPEKFAHRMRI